MTKRRGRCPKCASLFLFGGMRLRQQPGADVVKAFKAGPRIECRNWGADLRYVDRKKVIAITWATLATSFVLLFAAMAIWGNVGAIVAAIGITVAFWVETLCTEYQLAEPGHDR